MSKGHELKDAVNRGGFVFQENIKNPMLIGDIKDLIESGGMWECDCGYENFALMTVCPYCGEVEKINITGEKDD